MEDEEADFRHRCYHTHLPGRFAWRGVEVTRYGQDKFRCGNVKGNWKKAYEEVKRQAGTVDE